MNAFMDQDFLLTTLTAQRLYHEYAAAMPIIDYHCHVDPKEIFEDRRFENLFQVWLGGDHYKWRIMRSNGVDEHYITGDAPEREKFQKFAEALPKAIGNPMYHWCHLELRTYFGYEGVLNGSTAQAVWELSAQTLAEAGMSVRGILQQSKVAMVGTTDDPTSGLSWHKRLAEDRTISTLITPSFRPDKAFHIDKPGWTDYLAELGQSAGLEIQDLDSLEAALEQRMKFFDQAGCRAADHGLDYIPFCRPKNRAQVDDIVKRVFAGQPATPEEAECFRTELLLFCARQYSAMDWVMQLHYNCIRNPNRAMLSRLGPDSGFDCISAIHCGDRLCALLDTLYAGNALPRTILYSLNPNENEMLDTILGAFQGPDIPGKLQHGSAWWFNDSKTGMRNHLTSLASLSLLGNFVGMLTDSRSFLSYTRHAYFRRILCDLIGGWIENGEYPADMDQAGALVQDICYNNAKRYFRL